MTIRKSIGLSGITQLLIFLLNFGSILVISRLLTPEEIGVFSVSVGLLSFAHVLRDFGVGNFLIQAKVITRDNLRSAYSVMLYSSWTIAVLLYSIRDVAANFYDQPGIADVLGLIAINFLIIPFGAPVLTLLRREMEFGKVAVVSIGNAVVQVFVTVMCAQNGFSYLSMAWGSIAGMVTNVLLLMIFRPVEMSFFPTIKGIGEVLNFGYKSIILAFSSEAGNSAPDIILGRTLGFSTVAYYSRASGLIQMAVGQVVKVIYDVFLPAFAKDLREGEDPVRGYCKAMSLMVSILAPMIAFIMVMAEPLIILLFGDQWVPAVPIASVLSFYALISCPFLLAGSALIAAGQIAVVMRIQLVIQALTVSIFLTSIWLPLSSVILIQSISTAASIILHAKALELYFGLRINALWQSIRGSYLLVLLSISPSLLLRVLSSGFGFNISLTYIFILGVFSFVCFWLLAVYYINHPIKSEIQKILGSLGSRFK